MRPPESVERGELTATSMQITTDTAATRTAKAHSSNYLPHIDGLRAIAVLMVVGFHAGVPFLSGGYVGVDVFFVISGFLITKLLVDEMNSTGRIDLLDFYARRARRLLPALSVVLATTLIAGAIMLLPFGEQQQLAWSAVAAIGFVANIYFWRTQSDYFAGPAEEMPLLHLWTLSVEEQFYIVWPLAMLAVALLVRQPSARLRMVIAVLTVSSLASFILCWWLTPWRWTLVFYNMPFRAWEFGVGAALVFLPMGRSSSAFVALFWRIAIAAGVCALAIIAVVFDKHTPFPGPMAAFPVLATAAVIYGAQRAPATIFTQFLSSSPMLQIGKLSYSFYLWHWPILALVRASSVEKASLGRDLLLVLLALGLSWLTYVYVEKPVREQRMRVFKGRSRSILAGIALLLGTGLMAAALAFSANNVVSKDPVLRAARLALDEDIAVPKSCLHFGPSFKGLVDENICTVRAEKPGPSIILWGDSHARQYIPAFEPWLNKNGGRLVHRTMGECKPVMLTSPTGLGERQRHFANDCVDFNKQVLSYIHSATPSAEIVVIAAQWMNVNSRQRDLGDWEQHLNQLVGEIRKTNASVLLVADNPKFETNVPRCAARGLSAKCNVLNPEALAQLQAELDILKRVAGANPGTKLWDPKQKLCDKWNCDAMQNGLVTYRDDNHLSVQGARWLAQDLYESLASLTRDK